MKLWLGDKAWFKGNTAVGIHVQITTNGYHYFFCLLKKEKESISIVKSFNTDQLVEKELDFLQNQSIFLSIDGKGVMHVKEERDEKEIWAIPEKILPNAEAKDFYIQKFVDEQFQWLSFARIDIVQSILDRLAASNIFPAKLMLGAFPVKQVLTLLPNKKEFIFHLYRNKWVFLNGAIDKVEKIEPMESWNRLKINESLVIEEPYLLPFANALSFFGINTEVEVEELQAVVNNREVFFQKKLFQYGGWSALFIMLILLLINFFLFDYYSTKVNKLSAELGQKEELILKMDSLEQEYEQKKFFFDQSGLSKPIRLSYMADRLAATIPPSIQLESLHINPLKEKKIREGESPNFDIGHIFIKGISNNSTEFNEWIELLDRQEWIKDIQIEFYNHIEGRKEEFKLRINYI